MDFPVQQILELACAAQRYNQCYQKQSETLYADDGRTMGYKHSNKTLMLWTADMTHREGSDPQYHPPVLKVTDEDKQLTEDIRTYYRRLAFTVLAEPDNQFLQEIMSLLNKEIMHESKFGFIACLPSVYERDKNRNTTNKLMKECENSVLGAVEDKLENLKAKILDCQRSKNYDAWNVLAIIDNKIVSWFSKFQIKTPNVDIVSAKVKGHYTNYHSGKPETRLNYVKVAK